MFCPVCECEFREGFTRCEGCNADLVSELGGGSSSPVASQAGRLMPESCAAKSDFCGFVEMTEARDARDLLWNNGIASEIVIRPAPGSQPGSRLEEEFWLRVPGDRVKHVVGLLGFHEGDDAGFEGTDEFQVQRCDRCGAELPPEEVFCPHCGTSS
jgi:hypothetical protein